MPERLGLKNRTTVSGKDDVEYRSNLNNTLPEMLPGADYGNTEFPLVLLLHGLGNTHQMFRGHRQHLAGLGINTHAQDFPQYSTEFGFEEHAVWLGDYIETILVNSDIRQIILTGHSLGGLVALQYMSGDHQLVHKVSGALVSSSPTGVGRNGATRAIKVGNELLKRVPLGLYRSASAFLAWITGYREILTVSTMDNQIMYQCYRDLMGKDWREVISQIDNTIPIMFYHGTKDIWVKGVGNQAMYHHPNATYILDPSGRHSPPNPEDLSRMVVYINNQNRNTADFS